MRETLAAPDDGKNASVGNLSNSILRVKTCSEILLVQPCTALMSRRRRSVRHNERRPYVGVCGITEVAESNHLALRLAEGAIPGKQVMVGIIVAQHRERSMRQLRYPSRYPHRGVLRELLLPFIVPWAEGKCFAAIHYENETPQFAAELLYLLGGLEGCVHAVQLNIDTPRHEEIAVLARVLWGKIPGFRIILQVGPRRIREWEERGDPLSRFLTYIDRYADLVTDVVLDVSAGRGVTLDAAKIGKYLDIFYRWKHQYGSFSNLGIGVAGGLTPQRMSEPSLMKLFSEYQQLSVDAESGLRTADDRAIDLAVLDEWLLVNGARGIERCQKVV